MGQIKLAELPWNTMQTAEAERQATPYYMQIWLETPSCFHLLPTRDPGKNQR